jgi:hypothetical protein
MFPIPSISTLTKFKDLGNNYRITANGFVEKIRFSGMDFVNVGSPPISSGLKLDDVVTLQNNTGPGNDQLKLLPVKSDLI